MATLNLLPNGKVLAAGGQDSSFSAQNSAELYDPGAGSWILTAALGVARSGHTATLLPNGKVLVTAGIARLTPSSPVTLLSSAELFDSGAPTVAPGLFSANASGQGVAAAVALRIKADGARSFEPVAQFDAGQNRFIATPIDVGNPAEQVVLILFGTGFRHRSDLANVAVRIGNSTAEVLFAGGQDGFVGLDQCNVRLSPNLAGAGDVNLTLAADGKTSNAVTLRIK